MRSLLLLYVCLLVLPACAQDIAPLPQSLSVYSLEQFGPIATPDQADAALAKGGAALIAKGGGIIVIPPSAPKYWAPKNISQGVWREPAIPAPAKSWGVTPAVTVLDYRDGTLKIYEPQLTGLELHRTLQLPPETSIGHWGTYPMLEMTNDIIRGSGSFRDWIMADVKAGTDTRVYVRSLRGVFPGMFLNLNETGNLRRIYVKALGYDKEKNMPYFTTDIDIDIPAKGVLLSNKHNTPLINMVTNSHTENQTLDVMVQRWNYSQGDNYMFAADYNYMGDVHSTAGDENGVLYGGYIRAVTDVFRGTVDTSNPVTRKVKYKGALNAHTLGTGRPLINLNPKKWITGGTVCIARSTRSSEFGLPDTKEPVFKGRTHPTRLGTDPITGIPTLYVGGLIQFSADAPITNEVIGRYFAVDEPDEYVPASYGGGRERKIRRWYYISKFSANADGTKDIQIVRHWWGAKDAGAPMLYHEANYSADGHLKPLHYVIAPGANVYDVARGVLPGPQYTTGALERILVLTPGPDTGTPMDFAAGDPIEQAIGPDPFNPVAYRAWIFESVPGDFTTGVFDVANWGAVARHAVMEVSGGASSAADVAKLPDQKPSFENILYVWSACGNGIVFGGDVLDSALLFRQPNDRAQAMTWLYGNGVKRATLTVSPQDGTLRFQGSGASLPGGVSEVSGLSATRTKARNLRGIAINVPAKASTFTVKFPTGETDAGYAVFLELSWLTNHAITQRTKDGFTVTFATPAPKGATLDWLLVR